METNNKFDKILNLSKNRGFIFANSEIYGGLSNAWDYGPLGIELKNNIAKFWWDYFITKRLDMVGLDSAILFNPMVWKVSGHLDNFSDPLIDCKECQSRFRVDKLLEDFNEKQGISMEVDGWEFEKYQDYLTKNKILCPKCAKFNWSEIRNFNLMFKTSQGVNEETGKDLYLRPETAQGIFINFANILRTTRKKLPFGVGQIGKAFRNEITPGNFIFRTREFEQMEIEYFIKPDTQDEWMKYWEKEMFKFLYEGLKVNNKEDFRLRWHTEEELSHYSTGTFDVEYRFPFSSEFKELWGCASRTDFDLKKHSEFSGKDLKYFDSETNDTYYPYVVEPTFGLSRTLLMVLSDAYFEEENDKETRIVLKLNPKLAPYKVAVLPLVKKLKEKSEQVFKIISENFTCDYDETGSIGKRYRRQDEIGTPYCVTIDFDTTGDNGEELKNTVTVRNRDTMEQVRVSLDELVEYLKERI
jgi:glycyl-tRNA synthetase